MQQQVQAVPRFEVEKLSGTVERKKFYYEERDTGRKDKQGNKITTHYLKETVEKEDAGYMVYFARGHSIRVRSEAELNRLGLNPDNPGYTDPSGNYTDEDLAQMMPQQVSLKERTNRVVRQNSKRGAATKSSDQLADPEGD